MEEAEDLIVTMEVVVAIMEEVTEEVVATAEAVVTAEVVD